jgi:hypothetical protein
MASLRRPGQWEQSATQRPRVLIEHADYGVAFAAERILERKGYDLAVCGGPDHLRGARCSLVSQGRCELADKADVVVHGLNPDHAEYREVLCALRAHRPELPVVVEVKARVAQRHTGLLDDCTTLEFPMRSSTLEEAVWAAVAVR